MVDQHGIRQGITGRAACGTVMSLAWLLTGCEGTFTGDLATEPPADPAIVAVHTTLLGLEFERSGGSTTRLDFRDGEPVDLLDYVDGTPFRIFTGETLPAGEYTGVRLLFAGDADVTVVETGGGEAPGTLATGEFADASFSVEEDERSRESLTIVLDLRRSLVPDDPDAPTEYTLTPVLRVARTGEAAEVTGLAGFDCPTGATLTQGGAVYAFAGHDVAPDDVDGAGTEPLATARVFVASGSLQPTYALRFLPPGRYTVAATCRADEDQAATDDALEFGDPVEVTLDEGESLRVDLN